MQITITQRGGFVGGEVTLVQLDTARMESTLRGQVERRVGECLHTGSARERPVGADLLEYRLVAKDDGRQDSVTCVDDGGPSAAPIRDLVAYLQQLQ